MIFLWLLVPFGVAAFHYGPGQERLQADEGAALLKTAQDHLDAEEWQQAVTAFDSTGNQTYIEAAPEGETLLLRYPNQPNGIGISVEWR